MQKKFFSWRLTLLGAIVMVLGFVLPAEASSIAAPTVLKVNSSSSYAINAPVFSGVTPENTNVLVFIDDVFAGNAVVQASNKASDSFYFQAKGYGEGEHRVYFVSEDKESLDRSQNYIVSTFKIEAIPAPTLVVPNTNTVTAKVKPLITGLTRSGTFAHIFIDGVYNGKTKTVEHTSGTAHFAYTPFLNLSVGEHKVWAIAEDMHGRKSGVSKVLSFNIEESLPAPTIFEPVVNKHTVYNQPFIVGNVKNDVVVKVFIDKKLDGDFKVVDHKSGTANFAYKPKTALYDGKHLVYTTAVDERGKESKWSNIIYFDVVNPVRPAEISDTAVSEENTNVVKEPETPISQTDKARTKINDYLVFASLYRSDNSIRLTDEQYLELAEIIKNKTDYNLSASEKTKLEELLDSKDVEIKAEEKKDAVEEAKNADVEEILKDEQEDKEDIGKGGPIDEDKNSQRKLGWNALIFTLFLVAVIAWIFWVNRELIKEKAEQEAKNKEKK